MNQPVSAAGKPRPLVVTWCSARKCRRSETVLKRDHARAQVDLELTWRKMLDAASATTMAADLYTGRAFLLARETARRAGADLSVVSAGLGWVTGSTKIPSYDLTVSGRALDSHVIGQFNPGAWWEAAIAGPFSTKPSTDLAGRPLVLACVSRDYAAFFTRELERVPLDRLRIFGAGISRWLSAPLRPAILPYDERLGGLTGGTRADFAQRALQHFLLTLTPSASLEADRAAVADAMRLLPDVTAGVMGRRCTDDDVRDLITKLLPTIGVRRTPILRHLRDVLGVACEQGRFARLFTEVVGA